MSWLRKRWVLLRHPHAEISFGRHCYLGPGFSLHMRDGGTFVAGDGVEFRRGFRAELGPTARVQIGTGSVFTYDVLIQCTTSVTVGKQCLIAATVLIVDGSHRFRDHTRPVLTQGYDYRPITIGDGAAVMAKSTVIADVGERAFIGANSVVSRPVPPYSLAVGAPAEVIESYGPAEG
jgi:acetyltransferase-like isoleucine patch superfamily enzyme